MPLIDSYDKTDIAGQEFTVELWSEPWRVACWQGNALLWEMKGTVIAEENNRQTVRPYADEAEARVEFERWRT